MAAITPVNNGDSGLSARTKLNDNDSNLNLESLGKTNLAATSNPLVTNDGTQGYAIGSTWVNISTDESFQCLDITTGAAVWKSTTGDANNTDLGYTASATNGTVTSSTGNDATLPLVTPTAGSNEAGLLAPADKTKLDGIATGATANSSDATLLARANHTGTQLAVTISDFDTEVSNNASVAANTSKVSNATHTGDVTGSAALSIAADAVTNAKLANMAANTFKMNNTGSPENPIDGTIDQAKTALGVAAASGIASLDGGSLVPSAQISSASITQHEGDIDHNVLTNYVLAQHRIINDAGTTTTELLSASKILDITAAITAGVDRKESVATSTEGLGNITLSGEQTLNGVTTVASRVVITEQSTGADNGIYVTAAGAWARSADADSDAEVTNGMATMVLDSNSTKYRSDYILTTSDPITVGSTALTFDAIPALSFGTTAGTSAEGNDGRIPTQDENDALVGTGTPSSANVFVSNDDTRLDFIDTLVSTSTTQALTANQGRALEDGKQPLDSDLTAVAALSPSNDDLLQRKAGAWANRTVAQVKTDLNISVVVIEAKTEGVGAPYPILAADNNKTFTNTGATAEVYLDMPAATVGLLYSGICTDSDLIRFVADGTDTIRDGGSVSIAAGYIQLGAIGSTVSLICAETGKWTVMSANGTLILETS